MYACSTIKELKSNEYLGNKRQLKGNLIDINTLLILNSKYEAFREVLFSRRCKIIKILVTITK